MLTAMMMTGRRIPGTRVDLITASPWVVPGGVTSVRIFAYAPGGGFGLSAPYTTNDGGGGGSAYAGGAGGGGSIIGVSFSCVPGESITATAGGSGSQSWFNLTFSVSTTNSAYIESGTMHGVSDNRGGNGGNVNCTISGVFHNAPQGFGGTWGGSGLGGDGTQLSVGGGLIISGGGGGKGARVTPPEGPFAGGAAGSSFPAIAGVSPGYGGAGNGFHPGAMAIGSGVGQVTGIGNWIFDLYY